MKLKKKQLSTMQRWHIVVEGAVQGVGFRPYVYQVATKLGLSGWVRNSLQGASLEVQGSKQQLEDLWCALKEKLPEPAKIHSMTRALRPLDKLSGFEIHPSQAAGPGSALPLPDLAPCADCLEELKDPDSRRFRYPFTSCAQCGPRFSIIQDIPYDRAHTTMHPFRMCRDCQREYNDPGDRRFHAQPIACPACGPQLSYSQSSGSCLAKQDTALRKACADLVEGKIIALKGVGGFQLVVDATNSSAIKALRRKKLRPDKPFAIMLACIDEVRHYCHVSELEAQLLKSQQAPIVLLESRARLPAELAPGNPYLGVMLPASPLHQLLASLAARPLLVTSGNLSGEPLFNDDEEALAGLAKIADSFLTHDRPIAHAIDDSVMQVVAASPQVLRRARGYASLPIHSDRDLPNAMAVGGQQKSSFALSRGKQLLLSQYMGDLGSLRAQETYEREIEWAQSVYRCTIEHIACDAHPDYRSTRYAQSLAKQEGKALVLCQHHVAHIFACMAEHGLRAPLLGIAWDGTGLGDDGIIWGAEAFVVEDELQRIATLHPFRLPGGQQAIREPHRVAASLLYELELESELLTPQLGQLLEKGLCSPVCSSMGRLFDGVAALLGLSDKCSFDGQAACALQYAAETSRCTQSYPVVIDQGVLDWRPMLLALIGDVEAGAAKPDCARRFHNTLIKWIVGIAEQSGMQRVVLTGGTFQNKLLLEGAINALRKGGFEALWPQQVPPGDGGLALGQLYALSFSPQQSYFPLKK